MCVASCQFLSFMSPYDSFLRVSGQECTRSAELRACVRHVLHAAAVWSCYAATVRSSFLYSQFLDAGTYCLIYKL